MRIENSPIRSLAMVLVMISLVISCEQQIDLELATPNRQLVVEGRLVVDTEGNPQDQTIRLSTLTDFFGNQTAPAASGAQVSIVTPEATFDFTETGVGLYSYEQLPIISGVPYTLAIEWEGQSYRATETLVSVPDVDSIYYFEEEATLFEDAGIKVAIDFQDPAGESNYYFWEVFVDGELFMLPDPGNKDNVISDDDFFDGQNILGYLPNEELTVNPGEEVRVRQTGLSSNAYNYYFLLFDQAAKSGFDFRHSTSSRAG